MITPYGRDVVLIEFALAAVASFAILVTDVVAVRLLVWVIAGGLTLFTFYFFRDPNRTVPAEAVANPGAVLSPGDGKVVQIIPAVEKEFIGGSVTQVSIFLSPLNVHVNRIPISGSVGYFKYVVGKYVVAFHEKSSELNERTEIGVNTPRGKILFKQIAGYVARRIVCPLRQGDRVTIGERFGMIKFGSRVDVLFPEGSTIRVKVGDVCVGGETIVGVL